MHFRTLGVFSIFGSRWAQKIESTQIIESINFHAENHGKQLQIVKSQNNQISRFAIVSRDFHMKIQTDLVFDSDLVFDTAGNGD